MPSTERPLARMVASLSHLRRVFAASLAFAIMLPTLALNLGAALAVVPTAVPDEYVVAEDEALIVGADWMLEGWSARREIQLSEVSETESAVIRIDPVRIDYARTSDMGLDLRFVDSAGEVISHEIASWVEGGDSYVVLEPLSSIASSVVWMYYGNPYAADPDPLVGSPGLDAAVENAEVAFGPEDLSGVLVNDDADGPIIATLDVAPTNAAAFDLRSNGSFLYVPIADFNGEDTFTYRSTSRDGVGEPATVTIVVRAMPDEAVAVDDAATTQPGLPVSIDVLDNDSDPDGDPLEIESFVDGQHGAVTVDANGGLTYLPLGNRVGEDSFSYTLTGGARATVTVTVVQDPPADGGAPIQSNQPTLDLAFEANQGQAPSDVDYLAEGRGYDVILSSGEVALTVGAGDSKHEVQMGYRGGAADPEAVGIDPLISTAANPRYASVVYRDIYPGIDVTYAADGKELEYSFIVHPDREPSEIALEFSGARGLEVSDDGTLLVDSWAGRDLKTTAPYAYQEIDGVQIPVDSGYMLNEDGTVGFTVGDYDPTLPLTIDPTFVAADTAGGYPPNGGTLDLPVPPGVSAGDVLIAQVAYNAVAGSTITPVAGWNVIDVEENLTHPIMQGLYWRVATASEPAQYSFTLTSGKADTASGAIAAYSGVDTGNPIDDFAGQSNGTSTNLAAPSITTTVAGTTLIGFFANRSNGVISPPATMTERWDVGSDAAVGDIGETRAEAADELLAAAGTTGTRTATTAASDGSVGHLVALTPTVTTNLAPVATDDPPAGTYQVTEGGYMQWDVMGNDSDPNGDTLFLESFTQPSIGTVIRIDGGTPADTSDDFLRYDAPMDTAGPTSFTYTISDGALTDTATVSINVNLSNEYPVFDQDLSDRTDPEGVLISVSAGAADPDAADTLDYSATGLPVGLTIDSGSGLISGLINHAAAAYSPYSTEITVCDDGTPSRCDTDTFTWTVTNVVTTSPYLVAGTGGIGGGDDLLTTVDPTDSDPATNEVDIGTGTGTSGIESEGIQPVSGVLFTVDGNRLGILNTDHGAFTPVGTGLGTGAGSFGSIAFDNVTGMAFHPLTGIIWAVHSRPGVVDVLFLIDPDTGAHIPDAFGSGRDYQILRQHAGATDFTSLAFDPTDWQLYGVLTDGAGTDFLVSITRKNGNSNVVGSLAQPITDLSFDDFGQMWGIDAGTLYQIDKTNGTLDAGRTIDNGASYGALAFAVSPASPPALEGVVFEDLTGDALAGSQAAEDINNPGVGGVTVKIYFDNGAVSGKPDPSDTLFDSKVTGPTGHYFFEAVPAGSVYWLTVDSTTLNPTAGGTGWAEQTYGPKGAVTYQGGTYAFAGTAGPLYGGQRTTRSDSPIDASTAEHVAQLDLIALDYVEDMDFGFSFNTVTNLEGADASFEQGSLRQFISNANTASGPNVMRFVPVVPANDGTSSWWSLAPTTALPAITDAGTTIDGTAYDPSDGVTVLNPNTAGPELELRGSGGGGYGIEISADNTEVREVVINRFASGIALLGGDASVIAGNYLGPDATGLVGEVGNTTEGIYVYGATNTVVGGTGVADRNVISGNRLRGVFVDDYSDGVPTAISDGTQIIGNFIGTNATGAIALPYDGVPSYQQIGVSIWASPGTAIGTASSGNVISGNSWHGVYIWGAEATGNKIQGNTIGLDAGGSSPIPNGYQSATRSAVLISSAPGVLVGGAGAGEGNVIASNSSHGIVVSQATAIDNAIVGNSIFDNAGLGIDLELDGVTANDIDDSDIGPNDLLNFPVITSATETAGTITIDFVLDVPGGNYRIEFFTNTTADPSGNGEGETFISSVDVSVTGGVPTPASHTFGGFVGDIITATATENLAAPFGSTSEFSAAYTCTPPDTTVPVITLVGANPQTIEAGSGYVELGATATDIHDGDLTTSIVIDASAVITTTTGSYPVTYDVSDSSGNDAAQVTRTVTVVDTTAPVITLVGANPQTIEAGSGYVELGATATDIHDGDLTTSIVIDASAVITTATGSYPVTYDVSDSSGNDAAQVTRTVTVVDTTAPVITLVGANPQTIEAGSGYVELGATATDIHDGDLTTSIVIDASAVIATATGSYPVTYDVTDTEGNDAAQVTRTVTVVDTTAPVITLVGANPQTIEAGSGYVELGATATDIHDGDLTTSIVIDASAVITTATGSYPVTYDVTDTEGNDAAQVTRTVTVVDTTAPVITLVGANPQTIEAGSGYVELGATATDIHDGDLTTSIVIDASAVITTATGSYPVTYDVTDTSKVTMLPR